MFILCPHCQFLVAIDPASGLPPAHCPRCGKALVQPAANAAAPAPVEPVEADSSIATASTPHRTREADVRESTSAQPQLAQADAAHSEAPVDVAPAPCADNDEKAPAAATAAEETPSAAARPTRTPRRRSTPRAAARVAAAPEAPPDHAPATAGEATVAIEVAEDLPSAAQAEDDVAPEADAPAPAPPVTAAASRQRRAPSFAHAIRPAARTPRWRALAAIAALTLLLVLQVLLAGRATLAADARWRPLVASLCNVLQCALPAWHEPAAFTLLARDVRPARAGVLHVSASFRNDARWAQAWPLLHLALQDVDGRTVGARTLTPAEYRGRAPITQNSVATGQVANVAFDIAEPSATVVAFTFDFR